MRLVLVGQPNYPAVLFQVGVMSSVKGCDVAEGNKADQIANLLWRDPMA